MIAVLAGLVITVGVLGSQWVLHQSFFRVHSVTISGAHHESPALVLAATGLDVHPAMIDVSTGAVAALVRQFPWVDTVTVTKHWPSTVAIAIHEGRAVAVAQDKGRWNYVSVRGRNLGVAPATANLPTLVVTAHTTLAWPFATIGESAADVASELPRAFAQQVRLITIDGHGNVSLVMTTPVRFDLGPATNLRAKFVAIASVIKNSTLVPGDVVDVSVPDELAVTGPSPG